MYMQYGMVICTYQQVHRFLCHNKPGPLVNSSRSSLPSQSSPTPHRLTDPHPHTLFCLSLHLSINRFHVTKNSKLRLPYFNELKLSSTSLKCLKRDNSSLSFFTFIINGLSPQAFSPTCGSTMLH